MILTGLLALFSTIASSSIVLGGTQSLHSPGLLHEEEIVAPTFKRRFAAWPLSMKYLSGHASNPTGERGLKPALHASSARIRRRRSVPQLHLEKDARLRFMFLGRNPFGLGRARISVHLLFLAVAGSSRQATLSLSGLQTTAVGFTGSSWFQLP